jgi:uncharacterized protein YlxW (UPF0749 family)
MALSSSLTGPLLSALIAIATGAAGLIALQLARWSVDGLERKELQTTLEERRKWDADRDRMLVDLREEIDRAQAKIKDLGARLSREAATSDELLRAAVVRDRYLRLLKRRLREAGQPVPELPEADTEEGC